MPKKSKEEILIIGLGNPEAQYANSPHNAGFSVLDELGAKLGLSLKEDTAYFAAQGRYKGQGVLLIKPNKFLDFGCKSRGTNAHLELILHFLKCLRTL